MIETMQELVAQVSAQAAELEALRAAAGAAAAAAQAPAVLAPPQAAVDPAAADALGVAVAEKLTELKKTYRTSAMKYLRRGFVQDVVEVVRNGDRPCGKFVKCVDELDVAVTLEVLAQHGVLGVRHGLEVHFSRESLKEWYETYAKSAVVAMEDQPAAPAPAPSAAAAAETEARSWLPKVAAAAMFPKSTTVSANEFMRWFFGDAIAGRRMDAAVRGECPFYYTVGAAGAHIIVEAMRELGLDAEHSPDYCDVRVSVEKVREWRAKYAPQENRL